MPEEKKKPKVTVKCISAKMPIAKADGPVQISPEEKRTRNDWIPKPYNFPTLEYMVENSAILPQCIQAYKNNIAGFGISVKYKDGLDGKNETPEMKAEFDKITRIVDLLNTEQDTKEVFEDLIEARETYGIAYLEIIRDLAGNVVHIEFVHDVTDMEKSKAFLPYVETDYFYEGEAVKQRKKYRKYRQVVDGETVYFKEFGDPRKMDNRDGHYLDKTETVPLEFLANEIMEFAIGTKPYGKVRWMGQALGVDGAHRAENLNNNYFIHGRHTPLMIIVRNGTLTEESIEELEQYSREIEGESGQHHFLLVQVEGQSGRTAFDQTERPDVETKDLASILQKDELFQDYMENHRRKVQSSFLLPDLYVGYTTDFNRATAQTAQEVTEKQVFQPERASLAWAINNRLLNGYNFRYVEIFFAKPDITNPDDESKMLSVLSSAGGLTMNKAKEILYKMYGEISEDYEGDIGNLPIALAQASSGSVDLEDLETATNEVIEKAAANHDDEIVAVLKEIQRMLKSEDTARIIKAWDEDDHPRDPDGKFAGGGGGNSGSGNSGSTTKITSVAMIVGLTTKTGVTVNRVTDHAKERMGQRYIKAAKIAMVLTSETTTVKDGHTENTKVYVNGRCRVVFDEKQGNVITAYNRRR